MNEAIALLQNYVRMVWRYRWVALVGATLMCMGGWVWVMLLPPQYEVLTKVFLDTRSTLRPLLRGLAVDSTIRQDTAMMVRRTLLTRPNLESVARKTDMDLTAKTPEDFEKLLKGLAEEILVDGTSKDNIFEIKYQHADPKLATRVVESLLTIFVEKSLGESRKDTSKTRQFLDRQIEEYEAKLAASEERLKEFKQRHVGLMPSDGQTYYGRLEAMSARVADVRLELTEAVNRRDELRRQIGGEEPTFGFAPDYLEQPAVTEAPLPIDSRIAALQARLDELLLQYTDKHPDVITTTRTLEDLQAEREALLEARAPSQPTVAQQQMRSVNENPVFQEIKVALGSAEAEVAGLEARVAEFERREGELRRLVDTVPKVEADFKQLDRDYEILKKNYGELVERRESLKLSDEASQTTDDVQFNIVEPPREPIIPIGPDREMLSASALFFGVGAGIGFAWLLAMVRPAVYTRENFTEFTNLPVLGSVSRIWTPGMLFRRRMEVASFAVGCLGLIGLFGGLMFLYTINVDIVAKAQSVAVQLRSYI